ncbi:MAG: hypothetical protein R3350_02125, partial [Saprospiraceae bacterium]|nr:hypothetical protein [Saprospiraceae bacterium]
MSPVKTALSGYRKVERHILLAVAGQFCIQAVNTAFFLLLNYYMVKEDFTDYQVADVLSYRFLAVFCLAFPLGLLIKGRQLKPFFFTAAVAIPILSHLVIWAIDQHQVQLLNAAAMAWGLAYTCIQVTILPYILLNASRETHSEAISLSFLSFSATICLVGLGNYILHEIDPQLFDEKLVLQIVATISALSWLFIYRIRKRENISEKVPLKKIWRDYDWGIIAQAMTPTLLIAIGAGFTIPVINLFFLKVHGVSSEVFSILGAATFFLVACVLFFMPYIRRSFG